MTIAANGTDKFDQPAFDVHMDVLEVFVELELPRLDFLEDLFEARDYFTGFGFFNDLRLRQHFAMRDTAFDVIRVQPLVEVY